MKLVNNRRGPLYVHTVENGRQLIESGKTADADPKIYNAKHPFIKSRWLVKPSKEITDADLAGDDEDAQEPQAPQKDAAPARANTAKAAPQPATGDKKAAENGKPWHAPDAK